jgi:TonB-dependent SusC/RagA subfamily outer membrane receptor
MRIRLFTLLLLIGTSLSSIAQTTDTSFQKEWLTIDTLIVKNDLTRTALDKVTIVYQKAKQRQLPAQVTKALIYRYTLQNQITSNNPDLIINTIRAEISASNDEVQKAILYSMLATQYKQYFFAYRWNLYNRKNTSQTKKDSIGTWSTDDFIDAINANFLKSIEKKTLLQQQSIDTYNAVIIGGNSRRLRPTLYDLLAHEALDYFKSGNAYDNKPVNAFILNDANALGPINTFINTSFVTKDSSSNQWIALQVFQQLLNFHQNDGDKNALIEVNLERIEWVYQQANFSNKEEPYKRALEEIISRHETVAAASQAWYLMARFEANKAATYQPLDDTTNRYGYVKAKQLVEKALQIFTEPNRGTANMLGLLKEINRKSLRTQTEKVNIPGKPFRALVSYRNITKLYARVLLLEDHNLFYSGNWTKAFWKKITQQKAYKTFTQSLPDTKDHQTHSVEIKIDELPVGYYALLFSDNENFNDSLNKLSLQDFHVSNISYIQNRDDFFVLQRDNGRPISGAKIIIRTNTYNPKLSKNVQETIEKTSDKNGFFNLPESKNRYSGSATMVFTKGNDRLDMGSGDQVYYTNEMDDDDNAEEYEKNNKRLFFFTDRGIYRPGQTVFFKGIAVTKDFNTKLSKIIANKKAGWLYLKDVNRKKIDSLQCTLNEYGSFSGKFQLPQNVLTGQFILEIEDFNDYSFTVEEYKRPTFNTSFEKQKGIYRLNDSITVSGSAMAYSGNAIGDAKVSYTIQRRSRYIEPWLRRRPYPSIPSREIAHGEIKTDAQGKFIISFKALADDIIDRTGNPVFDFVISAAVTDISGETRTSDMQLSIGFAALQLKIMAPEVTETDSLKKIQVSTTNMSGQPEPSLVNLKIYSLQAPGHFVRKRLWARPDQFVMNKKEFTSHFPTDEYEEETYYKTWATVEIVKEGTINTKDNNALLIAPGSLPPGYYRIEAVTKDSYGEETKAVQYIQLFNSKNTQALPVNQFTYTVKDEVEPGETASFITSTFADQLFFIRKTERPKIKKGSYQFIERKKGFETITYTPDQTDRGGVSITEGFVYDNRIYTHEYYVSVPWNNKQLQVQYASYRDKTEPGSKETWTVSVQGDKNEKVAAELLTGMYDASLDQFKKHEWNSPYLWETKRWPNQFIGYSNFSITTSNNNYINEEPVKQVIITHDQLATNALQLARLNILRSLSNPEFTFNTETRQRLSLDAFNYSRAYNQREMEMRERVPGIAVSSAAAKTIQIRGASSKNAENMDVAPAPLYVVDGVLMEAGYTANPSDIATLTILKSEEATALYGSQAANGVIVVTTKGSAQEQTPVQMRKNFNETAFFFPQLYADSSGKYSFSFTMPESLTQWKWISLAHTKDLSFGTNSANIITQKKLMVQANAPRFMREGDNMEFSTKIVNLSDKEITGQVTLELLDATTNTPVDGWFQNIFPSQYFTVEAGKSFPVKFPIQIPFSFNKPLTWRVKARAGEFSDGEENVLPVLTNRMLVTESLPLFLPTDTTQHFSFDKLLHNTSESLTQEAITVEYTSNPIWYAVQALPYLMEYPYECAEQTFNRFYANALASYIVSKHPRIKQVFDKWKQDSSSLKSNLQKNEELKQVLLQETPWVMEAESEEQKKKNLSLLFDLVKLSDQTDVLIEKLSQLQLPNGSFSWFKGGREDRYMTNYILTGIGKLKRLGALSPETASRIRIVLVNALKYMDQKIADDYNWLVKSKTDLTLQHISSAQIDYLYMRSFFRDIAQQSPKEYEYFFKQGKQFWVKQNSYYKAKLGLIYYRNNEEQFTRNTILPALIENVVTDTKQGMYWKSAYTNNWYQSPIEHQSMMIAFMSELNQDQKNPTILKNTNSMKTWLLLNKQTNNWRTTIATADACYALLLNGSDWLSAEKKVTIQLGKTTINSSDEKTETATGYFKKRIEGSKVNPEMGNITVSINSKISQSPNSKISSSSPSWGTIYWQYFEDLDKITPAATPLSLVKKLFIEKNTDKGKILEPVSEGAELKTGDKIVVRLELRSDRDMDYLHLKDMRAASMEPVNVLSGYKWQDGLGYYESTKDASTNFFIDHLSKGTYVFDYSLFITHTGVFSVGIASIQCMYAPEFTSHSGGIKIRVAN